MQFPGIGATRRHRPLLSDYILSMILLLWGLDVLIFPGAMDRIPGYRWLTVPIWLVGLLAVFIGAWQIWAAATLNVWARRLGAIVACAFTFNFAVKVFESEPYAHVKILYGGMALGNLLLFVWPWM